MALQQPLALLGSFFSTWQCIQYKGHALCSKRTALSLPGPVLGFNTPFHACPVCECVSCRDGRGQPLCFFVQNATPGPTPGVALKDTRPCSEQHREQEQRRSGL